VQCRRRVWSVVWCLLWLHTTVAVCVFRVEVDGEVGFDPSGQSDSDDACVITGDVGSLDGVCRIVAMCKFNHPCCIGFGQVSR
jgi:hypothetical protein